MARTALTAVKTSKGLRTASIGTLIQTEAAGDNVNGHSFPGTGRDLLHVRNSAGGAGTVTFYRNAAGTATALTATNSVAAGKSVVFGPFSLDQFLQSDGNIYFDVSASTMNVEVYTLDSPNVIE